MKFALSNPESGLCLYLDDAAKLALVNHIGHCVKPHWDAETRELTWTRGGNNINARTQSPNWPWRVPAREFEASGLPAFGMTTVQAELTTCRVTGAPRLITTLPGEEMLAAVVSRNRPGGYKAPRTKPPSDRRMVLAQLLGKDLEFHVPEAELLETVLLWAKKGYGDV